MRPIRKVVRSILLSLLVPVLCVTTAWADVTDPCDSVSGPGSYQNLSPADRDYIGWDDPPDESYLCQQSNRRTASAVYRCSNAREVTVAVYSRYGSYAGYSGGELTRGGDELPLWYQSSTGEVYCDGRRMVYDADRRVFAFLEEEARLSGLVEYGLSVYSSEDGTDYDRVSVRLVSARREGPDAYWYEVYWAELEEGTRYLRLTLTDQSSIEILGREERYQFETVGGLSLASVEIVEEEAAGRSPEESGEPELNGGRYSDQYSDGGWWYDEDNWGTGSLIGTDSLPSYQPGEEQGPESLPWDPEEDRDDGGPAFPEEIGDRSLEEEPSGEESSSDGTSSSSRSSQSQQSGSSARKGQEGASDGPSQESAEGSAGTEGSAGPASALRRETSLWRRVTQPDAMTMVIVSVTLITMGIRILYEDNERSERRKERARREERYARYMSHDGDPQYDREDRRRRGSARRDDEDDDRWLI